MIKVYWWIRVSYNTFLFDNYHTETETSPVCIAYMKLNLLARVPIIVGDDYGN